MAKGRLLVGLILMISFLNSFGQNSPGTLSGNSASLAKDVSSSVSLYTGTPNINIPLFDVMDRELTFPVSLSYNASGIKVNDVAGWVGLGWNLNVGGAIVREVRGMADKMDKVAIPTELTYSFLNTDYLDLEPDIFYYNFNGYSGKFIVNSAGEVHMIPQNNLQVRVLEWDTTKNNDYYKWEITDENGIKYTFGGDSICNEEKKVFGIGNGVQEISWQRYNTAWYLKEARSPANNFITFNYEPELYYYKTSKNKIYNYVEVNSEWEPAGEYEASNWLVTKTCRLTHISSSLYEIDFIPQNNARTDLSYSFHKIAGFSNTDNIGPSYALFEIIINDKANNPLRKFRFETEHFNNKRLFLKSVYELSENGLPYTKPYKFDYNEIYNLPEVDSNEKDCWGYYNGYLNTSIQIPGSSSAYIQVHNLNPVTDLVTANMLTKIYQPNGEITEFIYEPNFFNDLPNSSFRGVRVSEIIRNSEVGQANRTKFTYKASSLNVERNVEYEKILPLMGDISSYYRHKIIVDGGISNFGDSPQIGFDEVLVENYAYINGEKTTTGAIKYEYINDYADNFDSADDLIYYFAGNIPEVFQGVTYTYSAPYCTGYEWRRGMMKRISYLNSEMELLKEVNYTYIIDNINVIPAISTEKLDNTVEYDEYLDQYFVYQNYSFYQLKFPIGIHKYNYISARVLPFETKEKIYDSSGINNIESTSRTYFHNERSFPIKTVNYTSLGDSIVTNLVYPFNAGSEISDTLIDTLNIKHILSPLIKKEIYKNNSIIGGHINILGFFNDGSIIRKKEDKIWENGEYISKNYYDSYDSYGNLLQTTSKFGTSNAIIWGYDDNIPVAQVSNAQRKQVFFENFENVINQFEEVDSLVKYSGKYSFKAQVGNNKKIGAISLKPYVDYILSYRVKQGTATGKNVKIKINGINEVIFEPGSTGWELVKINLPFVSEDFERAIEINVGNESLDPSSYHFIDDIRIYPSDASMSNSTIDLLSGKTSVTDENGITAFTEYDEIGRVSIVRDNDGNIIQKNKYPEPEPFLFVSNNQYYISNDQISLEIPVAATEDWNYSIVDSYGIVSSSSKTAGKITVYFNENVDASEKNCQITVFTPELNEIIDIIQEEQISYDFDLGFVNSNFNPVNNQVIEPIEVEQNQSYDIYFTVRNTGNSPLYIRAIVWLENIEVYNNNSYYSGEEIKNITATIQPSVLGVQKITIRLISTSPNIQKDYVNGYINVVEQSFE